MNRDIRDEILSPLPAGGERGFDGLIFVINKKSKEGVDSIFLFQNEILKMLLI
jgi:hypothetical protein